MAKEIDYTELKKVLEYQVKEAVKSSSSIAPRDIELVYDLHTRTLDVFEYICDDIFSDHILEDLILKRDVDGIVGRLIELIKKYDGTIIPPPYKDIDDWYGDYNDTINYFVWDGKVSIESSKRIETQGLKEGGENKCNAFIYMEGGAKKLGGYYTMSNRPVKLDKSHQQSLRWHRYCIELKDDRFEEHLPGRTWRVGVFSELGDNGKHFVEDAVKKVEEKYGIFEGYACDKWHLELDSYVTEKNRKMMSEIYDILDRHNIKMSGELDDE